ncbi:MAG TPA: GTP-binding protein [Xanthomonadales bacterium]|nr:GTP-binding protein [Xanthomonadales bacterium]
MNRTYKLLIIGEPGAGKTTCIRAVSDIEPISTDVECVDASIDDKLTTTVAFDYGELHLADDERLLLYGLPGQAHFDFMFDVVREGLLGVIVLVDAATAHALDSLDATLRCHGQSLRSIPCVLALNKNPQPSMQLLAAFQDVLARHGLCAPLLSIDARQREQIVAVFELLFIQIEHMSEEFSPLEPER